MIIVVQELVDANLQIGVDVKVTFAVSIVFEEEVHFPYSIRIPIFEAAATAVDVDGVAELVIRVAINVFNVTRRNAEIDTWFFE
jgi:hypothetical protein